MHKTSFLAITLLIFLAALTRLLPHPPNVAPIAAIALFAGAHMQHRGLAFLIPLAAMLLSDVIIGFHPGMFAVYLGMLAVTCIGLLLLRRKRGVWRVFSASVAGSAVFFAVTNFVWLHNAHQLYEYSWQGMMESYAMALPFFRNTLLGDLFFSGLLFGGYALLRRAAPRLNAA